MTIKRTKQSRWRFSLRTLLVIFTLLGIAGGVWFGMVDPIQQQWIAVEPILKLGGRVETQPSSIPNWMKRWLPEGKTENIEAVFFQYNQATDDAVKALEKLPYLRRLYLEKSQLKSHHLATIAKLSRLERLSIWGNDNLQNEDIALLGQLRDLDIIDIHACHKLNWRALLAFRDNRTIKVKHDVFFNISRDEKPSEYQDLKSVARFCKPFSYAGMEGMDLEDLEQLRTLFPEVPAVWVIMSDDITPAYFDKYLELSQKKFFKLYLHCDYKHRPDLNHKRTRDALNYAWSMLGPQSEELQIESDSGYRAKNMLTFRGTNRTNRTNGTASTIGANRTTSSNSKSQPFDVTIYTLKNSLQPDDNLFEDFPVLENVTSLLTLRYNATLIPAMQPLFRKIPNVETINVLSVPNFEECKEFWSAITQFKNVKQLSVSFSSTIKDADVGKAFSGSKMRDSLTRLEVRSTYRYEMDKESFKKTFPNLKSFNFKGEEVVKPSDPNK